MRVSFIHRGGPGMASYRYRAAIPGGELGASLNDLKADVLVFAKPAALEVQEALRAQGRIVVDFCDDHFDQDHYDAFAKLADEVTCPTGAMASRILEKTGRRATVIHDPYEFPEALPHCSGNRLLWFGHGSNFDGLVRILPRIYEPLVVVSNLSLARPWSIETMFREFMAADIVILPATAKHKSPNRAVESIRQGCFVVAEPHPSINDFPGIWIGDIPEGIEWASKHPQEANERTRTAQNFIRTRFSPKTQASAWRSLFEKVKSRSISGAGKSAGLDGSPSMAMTAGPLSHAT